jgi:hypothetical protein
MGNVSWINAGNHRKVLMLLHNEAMFDPTIGILPNLNYSGSQWCEVRGVGVKPTGTQEARPLHPLYSTGLQTAIDQGHN